MMQVRGVSCGDFTTRLVEVGPREEDGKYRNFIQRARMRPLALRWATLETQNRKKLSVRFAIIYSEDQLSVLVWMQTN